jgi:pimeloyl-ACP methyl ester carboxylesterase
MQKYIKRGGLAALLGWIIFAQSCMFFRTSDKKAGADFTKKGIELAVVYQAVGNRTVHYTKVGADSLPTIVFVHGSPGSWDAYTRYLQDADLRQRFRLIAIDRPGFGYSDFGAACNLAEQSALLQPLLQSWRNGRPIYLLGHSLGGPLVLQMAADYPQAVQGLVLLAAAIDPAQEKPEKWRKLLMNNPLEYLVPGAMRPSNYELWYLKNDLKQLKTALPGLSLPIWMVHGTHDQLVPFANMAFAQQQFAQSYLKLTVLEGANHFIPWSHYAAIKNILLGLPTQ